MESELAKLKNSLQAQVKANASEKQMIHTVSQIQAKQQAIDAYRDADISMAQSDAAIASMKAQSDTQKMIAKNYKQNAAVVNIDQAVRIAELAEKNKVKGEEIKETSAVINQVATDFTQRKNAQKSVREMVAQNVGEEEFQRWSNQVTPQSKQSEEEKKKAVADLMAALK